MSAIVVENLSKRYVIGHQTQADTLRDALTGGVRSLWNRIRRQSQTQEEFYALRDVSFSVEPGEVVGIIGRNGAGKSTLLKILSRITEPTTGRIALNGRVASLLEVGTGFHSELSGRENIFLNGAILGMSRAEIRRKFDEIVAFSEIERFLDTPVKRYSSGMYVRLAFAVAAHLEPEILIVDEVLAVGDAQFQKKCLGKIHHVASGGRTVLLVSHNESAIRSLCNHCILLQKGEATAKGAPDKTYEIYHRELGPGALNSNLISDYGSGEVIIRTIQTTGKITNSTSLTSDENLVITVETGGISGTEFSIEITIRDESSNALLFYSPHLATREPRALYCCGETIRMELALPQLASGHYQISIQLVNPLVKIYSRYEKASGFHFTCLTSGLRGWTFKQSRGQGNILIRGDTSKV